MPAISAHTRAPAASDVVTTCIAFLCLLAGYLLGRRAGVAEGDQEVERQREAFFDCVDRLRREGKL